MAYHLETLETIVGLAIVIVVLLFCGWALDYCIKSYIDYSKRK